MMSNGRLGPQATKETLTDLILDMAALFNREGSSLHSITVDELSFNILCVDAVHRELHGLESKLCLMGPYGMIEIKK